MNILKIGLAGAAVALALSFGVPSLTSPKPAHAGACTTDKARDALSPAEAQALYDCIADSLIEGYSKAGDVPGVGDYRNWPLVTTAPSVSSTHGGMFVNHFVSPGAKDLYTRWEDMNGAKFAVGTIFAKESFRVTKKGEVKRGPLFLMEKVADDAAPDGWVYTRLFPNGKFQRTGGNASEKMVFCHDCHSATLELQDAAFFPPEGNRVE
ncbi:MAG: cytochrome P460 family protein [Pseudomonadota bacterium]